MNPSPAQPDRSLPSAETNASAGTIAVKSLGTVLLEQLPWLKQIIGNENSVLKFARRIENPNYEASNRDIFNISIIAPALMSRVQENASELQPILESSQGKAFILNFVRVAAIYADTLSVISLGIQDKGSEFYQAYLIGLKQKIDNCTNAEPGNDYKSLRSRLLSTICGLKGTGLLETRADGSTLNAFKMPEIKDSILALARRFTKEGRLNEVEKLYGATNITEVADTYCLQLLKELMPHVKASSINWFFTRKQKFAAQLKVQQHEAQFLIDNSSETMKAEVESTFKALYQACGVKEAKK